MLCRWTRETEEYFEKTIVLYGYLVTGSRFQQGIFQYTGTFGGPWTEETSIFCNPISNIGGFEICHVKALNLNRQVSLFARETPAFIRVKKTENNGGVLLSVLRQISKNKAASSLADRPVCPHITLK